MENTIYYIIESKLGRVYTSDYSKVKALLESPWATTVGYKVVDETPVKPHYLDRLN